MPYRSPSLPAGPAVENNDSSLFVASFIILELVSSLDMTRTNVYSYTQHNFLSYY